MDMKNILKKSAIGVLILSFVVVLIANFADNSSDDIQTADPEATSITTTMTSSVTTSSATTTTSETTTKSKTTPTEKKTTTKRTTTTTAETTRTPTTTKDSKMQYVLNNSTMKFHYPECNNVDDILTGNRSDVVADREELIEQGYSPCGRCNP